MTTRAQEIADRARELIFEDVAAANRLSASIHEVVGHPDWVEIVHNGIEKIYLWDEVMKDYLGRPDGVLGSPPEPSMPPEVSYPESAPFAAGGKYAYLSDPGEQGFELLKQPVLRVDSNKSSEVITWETHEWAGRKFLGNSATSSWGERGPKWGWRRYNLEGHIKDIEMWRAGDFHQGREGHGLYANVYGDLTIENCEFVQCGAQALQLVWRAKETLIPSESWPDEKRTLKIDGVSATDCGVINQGSQVRASWPFAIYSPGHNIEVLNSSNYCNIAKFAVSGKSGEYRSHGSLIVSPAQTFRRTKKVLVDSFESELMEPDREDFRFRAVDELEMSNVTARTFNLAGDALSPVLDLVDVKRCVLRTWNLTEPLRIQIRDPKKPWGQPVRVERWDGTGTKEILGA